MALMRKNTTKRTYSELKDQELVRLFRRKADNAAFTELINRHQTKIKLTLN